MVEKLSLYISNDPDRETLILTLGAGRKFCIHDLNISNLSAKKGLIACFPLIRGYFNCGP